MAGKTGLKERKFKMEEVQPDLSSNEQSHEGNDPNLTIPINEEHKVIPGESASGKIYKYGLTLEELFNMSLDYYKKGIIKSMQCQSLARNFMHGQLCISAII